MIIEPPDALPDYDTAMKGRMRPSAPSVPVSYTFTNWANGNILVVPPRESLNPQPLYRITVELDLNPFLPVSYVTRIVRVGGLQDSELVAEFALSLNHKRAILTMGDTTTRLSGVLRSVNSSAKHFSWTFGNLDLRWDCSAKLDDGSPMCICYLHVLSPGPSNSDIQLASFVPPSPYASPPLPDAYLTVFPRGHPSIDHILVSALVVERMLTR